MAEKRMISKVISISEKVNCLPDVFDMLLFTWLIPHTDDFGRLTGSPAKVKALVVPMLDRTLADVEASLGRLHNAELILWYEINQDRYIQIINFEEHQQGLHKRTKSKIPEVPGSSGKFLKIPSEGKGRELKGIGREEEEKGTEGNHDTDSIESIKDGILNLINQCKIEEYTLYDLDIIYSYIPDVDIEVIEACIKKGQGKHVNYTIRTLEGKVKDGITKKDQLYSKPKVGELDGSSEGSIRPGGNQAEDKPITGGKTGALPSRWASKIVQMPNVSG